MPDKSGPQHSTSLTNLSHNRLSSSLRTDSTGFMTGPYLLSISFFVSSFFKLFLFVFLCLQCFDAVGWAPGTASGLQKMSGG